MKVNRHNFTTVEKVKDGFVVAVVDSEGQPVDLSGVQVRAAARVGDSTVVFELVRFEEPDKFGLLWPGFESAGGYPYDVFLFDGHTELLFLSGGINVLSRVSEDFEGDEGGFGEVVTGVLAGTQIVKVIQTDVQVCGSVNGKDGKDGVTPEVGENGHWWIDGADTGRPSVVVIDRQETVTEQPPPDGERTDLSYFGLSVVARTAGELREVALKPMAGGVVADTSPVWLDVWMRHAGETAWIYGGHSTTAVLQAANVVSVWQFAALAVAAGDILHLEAHYTPQDDSTVARLGSRVVRASATDEGIMRDSGTVTVRDMLADATLSIAAPNGVEACGVRLVTYGEMEAYVAEYVAAHAPAVDLADYRGPIHLRDESGNDVLKVVADPEGEAGSTLAHLVVGDGLIDCVLGGMATGVVISRQLIANTANISYLTSNQIKARHYTFWDEETDGDTSIGISFDGNRLWVRADNVVLGQQDRGLIHVNGDYVWLCCDTLCLQRSNGDSWPEGALVVQGVTSIVVSRP